MVLNENEIIKKNHTKENSKLKPLKLAISGTKDKFVIPGCVFISRRLNLLL